MDLFNLRNMQLAYGAVYDETLCESMEDLGLIGDDYYLDEARDGYGGDEKFKKEDDLIEKPGTTVPKPKKGGYGRIYRNIPYGIGAHSSRTQSAVTRTIGDDEGAPRAVKMPKEDKPKRKVIETPKRKSKPARRVIPSRFDKADFELWIGALLDEGYDLSEYTWDEMAELFEAEGSYGMTPNAHDRYSKRAREVGKGKNRSKAARLSRDARRTDSRPDPTDHRRSRMTPDDRAQYRRESEDDGDYDYEQTDKPSRPGGMPKGRKLARQRKTGVSEAYEILLSHLLDEGYAADIEGAEAILENMSEDWMTYIFEAGRPLPTSRMSRQARRKAFRAASETREIGAVTRGDTTAKQLRTMARVGGKKVKHHIKKGYAQGRDYDPDMVELNWRNPSRNPSHDDYRG